MICTFENDRNDRKRLGSFAMAITRMGSVLLSVVFLSCLASCEPVKPSATLAPGVETESRQDHTEYDFHYDIRYPGRLRSDVGLDTVVQEDPDDLKGYHRRTVQWWPKRGMDFTPLADIPGAPLRTWTPRVPKGSRSGTLPDNFPKKPFKAHLVNFRGVGDDSLKDVKDPESYRCPAAVLRFEDGHKRVILAKYLSDPDRRFLMDTYN
jgi:hypothetical protein